MHHVACVNIAFSGRLPDDFDDESGYTWTNDRDGRLVVWLLRDARLPDGRRGEAGGVYVIESQWTKPSGG